MHTGFTRRHRISAHKDTEGRMIAKFIGEYCQSLVVFHIHYKSMLVEVLQFVGQEDLWINR